MKIRELGNAILDFDISSIPLLALRAIFFILKLYRRLFWLGLTFFLIWGLFDPSAHTHDYKFNDGHFAFDQNYLEVIYILIGSYVGVLLCTNILDPYVKKAIESSRH
ncbi:hypothetical protein [Aliidiomarina celeris]|uniref:hypothetical protein n=1 Tax=Aliidiomarina celeris TaxID=2249428 RepID=UPI000DE8591A|nr:hypothetical protein [Aliidiomarina celeris]